MRQYIPYSDRTHNPPPLRAIPAPASTPQPIPKGAKLVSVETARKHLWESFEIKFSRTTADTLRRDGKLALDVHYRVLANGAVRYYLPALEQYFGV